MQAGRVMMLRRIMVGLEERVKAVLEFAEGHGEMELAELEREAWRLSRDCFAAVGEGVMASRREVEEGKRQCACGGELRYKGEQGRQQETLVGLVRWHRGYYRCQECGRGRYPLDEALAVAPGQFSECVQERAARLAVDRPFREAAAEFSEHTGIALSAREIARITEERGEVLEGRGVRERQELLRGEGRARGSRRAVLGRAWAVALEATKVRFEDGWHEVKAGSVFWVQAGSREGQSPAQVRTGAEVRAKEQSYIAHVGSMEEAGARLYAEVIKRGIDPALELLVCLGDGAPGIWNQYALHFPLRVEVLDWYHASEHLWAAGNGVFGEGTQLAKQWVAAQEQLLWDGKVEGDHCQLADALSSARGHSRPGADTLLRGEQGAHALSAVSRPGLPHRQWHGGERLQARRRRPPEGVGHVLGQARRAGCAHSPYRQAEQLLA